MGALNYGSNKNLINLGLDCENIYEEDFELVEEIYLEIERFIDTYNFNFYDVYLEAGYYDGFYLVVEDRYIYMDNFIEKLEMQKELTKIKSIMQELISNYRLKIYTAGWVTSWVYSEKECLKLLNESVKRERCRIRQLYTDRTILKLSDTKRKEILGW